jgi:hypothetical protein
MAPRMSDRTTLSIIGRVGPRGLSRCSADADDRPHRDRAATGIRARTLGAVPQGASKEQQDAAMNELRKQVQAEYDKPGGALWRAAAAEVKLLVEARVSAKK